MKKYFIYLVLFLTIGCTSEPSEPSEPARSLDNSDSMMSVYNQDDVLKEVDYYI